MASKSLNKAIISLIFCAFVSLCTGCKDHFYESNGVPSETDLVYWIAEPWDDSKSQKLILLNPGMGIESYLGSDYDISKMSDDYPCVQYTFSGYPDAKNNYHTTQIRITDPNVRVLGLTFLSSVEDIESKRQECNYKKNKKTEKLTFQIADKVSITFNPKKSINLSAITTNKDNISF